MSEGTARVLDYLGYKNKIRAREWEERLWRQHMTGLPEDVRAEEERRRYLDLQARATQLRSMAQQLYRSRVSRPGRYVTN